MFACVHRTTTATELNCVAQSFAPVFEMTGPGTVVFDIGGLSRLYGSPRQIAEAIAWRAGNGANVAVAANVETAILAARNFNGVTVICGQERDAIAPLGIEALPLSPEMWETLDSWGIRTLADFAKLPPLGIAERLGPEGVHLQDLARGALERPLRVHKSSVPYEDRIELEHPVELLEPLLFLIARILNDLCERMESQALAASEIAVRLELENRTEHARTLRLPLPTRDSRAILKLLQLDLEAHPPAAAMTAVSLSLKAVQPRRVQNDIFLPPTPEPDKLEITLTRIRALVGEHNVGVPELLDTHRPRPFRLAVQTPAPALRKLRTTNYELRTVLRFFKPAVAASVRCDGLRPVRIDATDIHGNIVTAAGPWRTSGDWWTTDPWDRDEWDVALSNDRLYRIYCEPSREWFVEALYD
jgi:protein ImuB